MSEIHVSKAAWEALGQDARARILEYLVAKGVVSDKVEVIPDASVTQSGQSFKAQAEGKGHYEDVVDACDGMAQIIHDGMVNSGDYSQQEAGDFAAEFFDHCCTIGQ